MPTNVFANGDEIACKAGDGKVIAAFPDVCLSPPPTPAGPIPIPYPDTSFSKDMQSGSSTVQIGGDAVMLKDQSFYQSSPLGDEAATNGLGAGVVTACITGKTYFTAWSMDVQFEGQNVDRNLDLTTSNHSSQPPNEAVPMPNMSSLSPPQDPPKTQLLQGKVTKFAWTDSLKLAYAKGTVNPPHWTEGEAVEDGGDEKIDGSKGGKLGGSKKPAAYLVADKAGTLTATVTVEITENVNVSGDATLYGVLGSLVMEGTCPSAAGTHADLKVTIKTVPDSIQWYKGSIGWILEVPDMSAYIGLQNRVCAEVFFVLDTPASFYDPGVWTEALRFLCGKVGVTGLKKPEDAARVITQYCHSSHGLRYDTIQGAPSYGVNQGGGTFGLLDYIKATKKWVNCYDQASAVQALCGALGVTVKWDYLAPYGFINTTNLVGIGSCNSPFFTTTKENKPVVKRDDPERTSFGNHAFCELGGKIFDACAGPHGGTETPAEYCTASIDTLTTLYARYINFKPGTAAQIVALGGVGGVE